MPVSIESWDSLVHPDDKEGAYAALKDHLDAVTEAYSHEHRMRCKDGTYRWEHPPPIPVPLTRSPEPSFLFARFLFPEHPILMQ